MLKNPIVSQEVVFETPGGSKIIVVHLSKEAQEGLTIRHIPLPPPKPDEETYQFRVREGDFVRLPNADTGTVYMIEFHYGEHVRIVSVRPTKKRRWFGLLPAIPQRFADTDINRLTLLATQAEWEAIEC